MMPKPKLRKYLNLLFRLAIGFMAYYFLYRQLILQKDKWADFCAQTNVEEMVMPLVAVFLLMVLNWGLEAVKWRQLIQPLETIGFRKSFLSVLSGITISFFTPNRVGEFLGRVLTLSRADRIESSLLTIVGSISQWMCTVIIGFFGLLVFLYTCTGFFGTLPLVYFTGFLLVYGFIAVLALFLYLHINYLSFLGRKDPGNTLVKKILSHMYVLGNIPGQTLRTVLKLSFLRYMVFTVQAWLLLYITGVSVPFLHAGMLISVIFLLLSVIPTMALAEIGVRGSVAGFIFNLYFHKYNVGLMDYLIPVIIAFSLLWVINIALPAFLGGLGLSRLRFFRKALS